MTKAMLEDVLYELHGAAGDFRVQYAGYCAVNKVNNASLAELSDRMASVMRKIPLEWVSEIRRKRESAKG